MPKHVPLYDTRPIEFVAAPNTLPSWDHEALALKVRSVDGCTDAERQIDKMAQTFSQLARPRF